jgi:hypothetical protein
MSNPDKRTILAATLYGLADPKTVETRKGNVPVVWADLGDSQKPFIEAAEFLLGQAFGVDPQSLNRAKLAANFESAKIIDVDANVAVAVFASVLSVLP